MEGEWLHLNCTLTLITIQCVKSVCGPPCRSDWAAFLCEQRTVSSACEWVFYLVQGCRSPGLQGRDPTGFSELPGGNLFPLALLKADFCLGGQKTRLDRESRGPGSDAADLVPCLSASQKCCIYDMPQRLCNCIILISVLSFGPFVFPVDVNCCQTFCGDGKLLLKEIFLYSFRQWYGFVGRILEIRF